MSKINKIQVDETTYDIEDLSVPSWAKAETKPTYDYSEIQNTPDLTTKQDKIDSTHKLDADLVDDTNATNKFVSASDKTTWNSKYDKPIAGIPKTDLTDAVQTSLELANTSIQSSDLSAVATSGDYDDLTNKPTIPTVPTNVSAFTNDAGYLTSHQDISGKQDIMQYSTMPTANSSNEGKIVQFTGTTDVYTNGYFYKCVAITEGNETTYSWEQENVQPAPSNVETTTNKVSSITSSSTNVEYAGAKAVWDLVSSASGGLIGNFIISTDIFDFTSNPTGIYFIRGDATSFKYRKNSSSSTVTISNTAGVILLYYKHITEIGTPTEQTNCAMLLTSLVDFFSDGVVTTTYFAVKTDGDLKTGNYNKGIYFLTKWSQQITGTKKFLSIPFIASNISPSSNDDLVPKRYVDNKPTTYTGYDATKTQVLKNVNGTLTWVDES